MKFEESYAIIKSKFDTKDMSKVDKDFSAVITITGKNGGYVYAAYIKGKKIIEPVKHDKASLLVTLSDETFEQLVQKKVEPFKAFATGKIKAKGNLFLAMSIYKKLR